MAWVTVRFGGLWWISGVLVEVASSLEPINDVPLVHGETSWRELGARRESVGPHEGELVDSHGLNLKWTTEGCDNILKRQMPAGLGSSCIYACIDEQSGTNQTFARRATQVVHHWTSSTRRPRCERHGSQKSPGSDGSRIVSPEFQSHVLRGCRCVSGVVGINFRLSRSSSKWTDVYEMCQEAGSEQEGPQGAWNWNQSKTSKCPFSKSLWLHLEVRNF